jgi:hypothetical protein
MKVDGDEKTNVPLVGDGELLSLVSAFLSLGPFWMASKSEDGPDSLPDGAGGGGAGGGGAVMNMLVLTDIY